MDNNSIILIGPLGTGKTTIGEMLGEKLKRRWIELDEIRQDYYAEIGYDAEQAKAIRQEHGFKGLVNHWKPFEVHSVERVLADYPDDFVISFGAGHSVYEEEALLNRAKEALISFPNVVLLLPSEDVQETIAILDVRLLEDFPEATEEFLAVIHSFITHRSNSELAKITIYNAKQTPEETCQAIIQALNLS